jgi:hypothetical protein
MQQTQAQRKYSELFTICPQHNVPKVNPKKINEYLTNLLIENFEHLPDTVGIEMKASVPRMTKTKRVLNQVNILSGNNEMYVQILYNDSYKVACDKLDALTEYIKGSLPFIQLRRIKTQNKWN